AEGDGARDGPWDNYTSVVLGLLFVCGYFGIGGDHNEAAAVAEGVCYYVRVVHVFYALLSRTVGSECQISVPDLVALLLDLLRIKRVYELVSDMRAKGQKLPYRPADFRWINFVP
ncbi:MAG TPA: hypothetical protein VIH54_01625, partial [Chthoniobacterales bacterium]